MSQFSFAELKDDSSIQKFLTLFAHNIGVLLPDSYAGQGKTFGMFRDGQMVGGFMLITKGAFRSVKFIPDASLQNQFESGEFFEINGVWLDKSLRKSSASASLWLQIRKQSLRLPQSKLLLMYNLKATGLQNFYSRMLKPTPFYSGPSNGQTHGMISVGTVTKRDLSLAPLRGMSLLLNWWTRRMRESLTIAAVARPAA